MATNYPASLDNLTNPVTTDPVNSPSHAVQHANANDAIEALQAKVGTNNSAVATSLDYRVRQLELNPVTSTANKIEQVVVNNTGSTLLKGQVVYASGSVGASGKLRVSLSSNAAESTSSKTFGVLAENIINGGEGLLVTEGLLENIDTTGANDGDPIWLGTNGSMIFGLANKPAAPAHLVFVGIVVRGGNANNGSIFVKVQNGFELDELHTVSLSSLADKDLLTYDSATGLWKNKTFTTLDIPTKTYVDTALSNLSNTVTTDYVPISDVGQVDGVASLDSTGKIPDSQIPAGIARDSEISTAIANLVNSAPSTLDTLNELATALGNDANFSTTITTALGNKLDSSTAASTYAPIASPTFTGNVVLPSTTTYSGTNIQTLLDAKSNKTKIVSTKIADYVLTTSDNNRLIEFNSSSDLNLILPTYSNAAFSYGDNFSIVNRGSGKVNILNQSGTSALSSYSTTGSTLTTYSSLYANGIYIAQTGTSFYRSTDAITWTFISGINSGSSASVYNQRIAYGAGLYLLAASTGIWSSSNGTTWTQRLSGTNTIYSIKYANNKFMAGAANGLMYTSTDGITWTSLGTVASLAAGATITSIEYVSSIGTWFATHANPSYLIKSTDNGATWTQITGNNTMKSLATNGSILVGNYPGNNYSSFYTTTDGVTLTVRSLPFSAYSGKIIWDGTQFVMGYTNTSSPYTLYQYTSTDGINWSVQSSISPAASSAANTLVVGASGQYIYLGTPSTAYTSGSVTTSYISKNNGSYIPAGGRSEIYNYNQNQFVVSGDLGNSLAVSSNITLLANNKYFVDTAAARTLTLPAYPSVGDEIQVFDASNLAGTNNVTISSNGGKINGSVQDAIVDVNGGAMVLIYTGSTYGWRAG